MINNCISLVNIWTSRINLNLKVRYGKIQNFNWFNRDQNIIGCANSGIVAVWNTFSGQTIYEYVERSINFRNVLINSQNLIFAFDHQNNLRILKHNSGRKMSTSSVLSLLDHNNLEDLVLEKIVCFKNLIKNDTYATLDKGMPLKITCFTIYKNWIILGSNKDTIYFYDFILNEFLKITDNRSKKIESLSSISQLLIIRLDENEQNLICFYENGSIKIYNFICDNENNKSEDIIHTKKPPTCDKLSNDILIYKKDLKQAIKKDLNLRNLLEDQEEEKRYQLKLKDVIHNEEIKTMNYQAKIKFTYLRNFINKKKYLNDQQLKSKSTRFNEVEEKLQNDLRKLKEKNESQLISKYTELDQLSHEFAELKKKNESLVTRINNLLLDPNDELNLKLENDLEAYQKIEVDNLNSSSNARLKFLQNMIKYITRDNYELELEEDNLIQNLKYNLDCVYNDHLKKNEQLKNDILICKYNIESLKEIIEKKNEAK